MNHLIYADQAQASYPIVFLVPQLNKGEIDKHYLRPFGVNKDAVLCLSLHYAPGKKKTPMKEMRQFIDEQLGTELNESGAKYVMCADAEYFKALTKLTKAEPYLGYACDTEYGDYKVFYIPNYKAVFYDPEKVTAKIEQSIDRKSVV